jgi:hypothetical protein
MIFGLASLGILLVSPLSWGHYYVFALPAGLFVPLWLRRHGFSFMALLSAATLPVLTCSHYALKPWCGPIGLLGLGTTLWFLSTSSLLLFFHATSARLKMANRGLRAPAFLRFRRVTGSEPRTIDKLRQVKTEKGMSRP